MHLSQGRPHNIRGLRSGFNSRVPLNLIRLTPAEGGTAQCLPRRHPPNPKQNGGKAAMNKQIRNAAPSNEQITRGSLPGSRKIHLSGVPFREVGLSGGEPPVRLYDTSGPYTDDAVAIEIAKGLKPLRREWIVGRGDVEAYDGRARRPEDDGLKHGELL